MLKKILILLALITGIAPAGFGQDQRDTSVEFEGRVWFPEMTAHVQVTAENLQGTVIDLERDLGLRDEDFPEGRFVWYTGPKSRLYLNYTQRSFSAERILNRSITFRGRTFDVNARAATDLDIAFTRLGWAWEFITSGNGFFKLGTLLEARGVMAKMSIEGQVNAQTARVEKTVFAGLPTIGFALDINPGRAVNIFAVASGFPDTKYGYALDTEAGLKLIPFDNFSLFGGYRYMRVKGEKDDPDDFVRVSFSGPFAGASLRF